MTDKTPVVTLRDVVYASTANYLKAALCRDDVVVDNINPQFSTTVITYYTTDGYNTHTYEGPLENFMAFLLHVG